MLVVLVKVKGGTKRWKKVRTSKIYSGDEYRITVKDLDPVGEIVPYSTDVKGMYYDGYPQLVKQEGSKLIYEVKVQKDIMVPMRDGIRLAVDIYRPEVEGDRHRHFG